VGISAISASDTPIAHSSVRRPDPGTREYFRTAIGPQDEFPPVSAPVEESMPMNIMPIFLDEGRQT
jgi:hypothetical protein